MKSFRKSSTCKGPSLVILFSYFISPLFRPSLFALSWIFEINILCCATLVWLVVGWSLVWLLFISLALAEHSLAWQSFLPSQSGCPYFFPFLAGPQQCAVNSFGLCGQRLLILKCVCVSRFREKRYNLCCCCYWFFLDFFFEPCNSLCVCVVGNILRLLGCNCLLLINLLYMLLYCFY